jgi:hypothetical protein
VCAERCKHGSEGGAGCSSNGRLRTYPTAERPTRTTVGKRTPKSNAASERQFVDIDPWAVLLEQLMEVPAEGSAASEPGQGGTSDQPEPRRPKRDRGK